MFFPGAFTPTIVVPKQWIRLTKTSCSILF